MYESMKLLRRRYSSKKIPGATTAGSKDKTFGSGVRVFDIYEVVPLQACTPGIHVYRPLGDSVTLGS